MSKENYDGRKNKNLLKKAHLLENRPLLLEINFAYN